MNRSLLIAFCFAFFVCSVSAWAQNKDLFEFTEQVSIQLASGLKANNSKNSEAASLSVISSLETRFKDHPCNSTISKIADTIKKLFFLKGDSSRRIVAEAIAILFSLNSTSHECVSLANLARKLISGVIKTFTTQSLADKLADRQRFLECFYSGALLSIIAKIEVPNYTPPGLFDRLYHTKGCNEALQLEEEIILEAAKEEKTFAKINKIVTTFFSEENSEEVDFMTFNQSMSGVWEILREIGYADLCLNEFTVAFYQAYIVNEFFPAALRGPFIFLTYIVSLPYHANKDCLPFANAVKYSVTSFANAVFDANYTFVPIQGGLFKISDRGIASNSTIGESWNLLTTGIEALRCGLATASVAPLVDASFHFATSKDFSNSKYDLEIAMLEALGGSTSCMNAYNSVRHLFGL